MGSEAVRFPPSVVEFLRANPGYTKKHAHLGLPPEELYFRYRVLEDWETLRPHLPAAARDVLDIGCGIAGIDLVLSRALQEPRFFLVDKSRRAHEDKSYDVVAAAREFLTANGVAGERIVTLSSQRRDLHEALKRERYDLVLSLRGLCYMFPYQTYRQTLREVVRGGGRLILDVRRMDAGTLKATEVIYERFRQVGLPSESEVFGLLEEDFGRVEEIGRSQDYVRVCVRAERT